MQMKFRIPLSTTTEIVCLLTLCNVPCLCQTKAGHIAHCSSHCSLRIGNCDYRTNVITFHGVFWKVMKYRFFAWRIFRRKKGRAQPCRYKACLSSSCLRRSTPIKGRSAAHDRAEKLIPPQIKARDSRGAIFIFLGNTWYVRPRSRNVTLNRISGSHNPTKLRKLSEMHYHKALFNFVIVPRFNSNLILYKIIAMTLCQTRVLR